MFHAQTVKKLAHLGWTTANTGEFFDGALRFGTSGGRMFSKMLFQTILMGTQFTGLPGVTEVL